jgi:threonine efflux protein
MELHLWVSLVTICILGALSPGPSLALVIKNTLHGGHAQGYATAISHGLGVAIYAAITATGIGLIIVKSPTIFAIIQYTGAAFLFYLGAKALMTKQAPLNLEQPNVDNKNNINGWRDGFLIAFLNPKLAIFFLALFSQFVDENAGWQQKLVMTATVGGIDTFWYCLVTYGLSRGPVLKKLKANHHIVDRITGCFLILLAARVVWV